MPSRRAVLAAAAAAVVVEPTLNGCTQRKGATTVPGWRQPGPDGRPWILVSPHPDDETLGAGTLIANHVAAGREVHVLLLSRGLGSVARLQINGARSSKWWGITHNPAAEGYTPLTVEAFGRARLDEITTAVRALGGGRIHEAGLIDEQVTVGQAKDAIAGVVASVGRGAGVFAPSWLVDDNPDHRAAGQALRELAAEQPKVYAEVGWYILPRYWSDPRLKQVSPYPAPPVNGQVKNRARNACRAYGAWNPPYSYAIGEHSVDDMFALVEPNPKSMLHK